MDKKTNQMLFGLGIVLTIGGLYYIMKKKLEVSNKSDAEEGLTEPEKKVIEVQEPSALVSGDFKNKVKTLQTLLGFTGDDIDGDPGTKTKTRLENAGLGRIITPDNINSLISTLQSRVSSKGLTEARKQRAISVTRAAATRKKYTWTDKPASLPIYIKDALGNYNKTNEVLSVNSTSKFNIPIKTQTILSSGFIRAEISEKGGKKRFIIVSPYSVTVY